MSDETTEKLSEPRVSTSLPVSVSVSVSDGRDGTDPTHKDKDSASLDTTPGKERAPDKERGLPPAEVSMSKAKLQDHLPALDDDADIGVQKEHIVTRDGKADLRFTGVLLASAAPASAPEGHWRDNRLCQNDG